MAVTIPGLSPQILAAIAAAQGKTPAAPVAETPMGAFAALAPSVLGNQAAFARPEAAAWLAQMTGQPQPTWTKTPAQLAAEKRALDEQRARTPAGPAKPPTTTPPKVTIPPVFSGFGGMFSIPANIQELIAKYRAGIKTPVPATPTQSQAQAATPGPAPSAFAGLRALQGPFGNGGGGLNMQALISAARGRIL